MDKMTEKMVAIVVAMVTFAVMADTHVWKSTGRVNDWDWNEPGNYDSSLGAAGVPSSGDIVQLPDSADIFVLGTDAASMGIVSGLAQIVTPAAGSRVIFDLGSGTGLLASFWYKYFPTAKYILADIAEETGCSNLDIQILRDVDRTLYDKELVITSDSVVLDHCRSWVNLTAECVKKMECPVFQVW